MCAPFLHALQALVVQRLDRAIHRINHYPKDGAISFPNTYRAANNGRSTDNVRPDRGLDRSNSGLAGHFERSFLDTNTLFSIQLSLSAL